MKPRIRKRQQKRSFSQYLTHSQQKYRELQLFNEFHFDILLTQIWLNFKTLI
jgi:hypothetical protein